MAFKIFQLQGNQRCEFFTSNIFKMNLFKKDLESMKRLRRVCTLKLCVPFDCGFRYGTFVILFQDQQYVSSIFWVGKQVNIFFLINQYRISSGVWGIRRLLTYSESPGCSLGLINISKKKKKKNTSNGSNGNRIDLSK